MLQTAEVGSTANKYEILAKLATGGMAEIFLARAVTGTVGVRRYVVLKRILREFATNKNFVRMFIDEAKLVAQLQHPNIAQVHDVGQLGDTYFFTMEYVHGETVRALLSQSRKMKRELPLGAVLAIAAGAAAGLHHAHEKLSLDGKPLGIVHRDVTPSNLMVSFEGNVKVVDFGVAKAGDTSHETKSGTIKGKTNYLSPEQCRGMVIDRRSDLFSLGIVMWEMLTCERLFRKGSEFDAMSSIVNEDAPAPSTINPNVPPDVDALVGKLLARDRDLRFATAQDVIDQIEDIAVANRAKLSASVLVRLLRETFGTRPEPWIVLEQAKLEAPTVTVTADIGESKEIQLHQVPGLELVDDQGKRLSTETSGGLSAADVVALSSDDDLAIPRAPVLPVRATSEDESSAPMFAMEDLPTSRWNIVSNPELDLDKAVITAIAPPLNVTTPPPVVEKPTARQKLRTPIAGVPVRADGSGEHPPVRADGTGARRVKTNGGLDESWGSEDSEAETPPPQEPPITIALPRTRTPLPPPPPPPKGAVPFIAPDEAPAPDTAPLPLKPTKEELGAMDTEAFSKLPLRADAEATPTPTPTIVEPDGDATTIEPMRDMPGATPTPMKRVAFEVAEGEDNIALTPLRRIDPKVKIGLIAAAIVLLLVIVVAATRGGGDEDNGRGSAAVAGGSGEGDDGDNGNGATDGTNGSGDDGAGRSGQDGGGHDGGGTSGTNGSGRDGAGTNGGRDGGTGSTNGSGRDGGSSGRDGGKSGSGGRDGGATATNPTTGSGTPVRTGSGSAIKPTPQPPKPKFTKLDLRKLYETAQYGKLVTSCSAGGAAIDSALCVLAACRTNQAAKAKQWFAITPAARRAPLLSTCATLGVPIPQR